MSDVKFRTNHLVPVIIQDIQTSEVLMLAYMDKKAFQRTLKEKKTVFFSRSRKEYWLKGETSGHIQEVKEVLTDCDRDAVLIKVKQTGGACHLGYRSCFVHQLNEDGAITRVTQEKVFDPDKVYKK